MLGWHSCLDQNVSRVHMQGVSDIRSRMRWISGVENQRGRMIPLTFQGLVHVISHCLFTSNPKI